MRVNFKIGSINRYNVVQIHLRVGSILLLGIALIG